PENWVSATGRALPADRPPTVLYRPFPNIYTPPFHYSAREIGVVQPSGKALVRAETPVVAELDRAQHDLERLESRDAIENLQAAYGYYVDKGLWDEASSLFSRGGGYEYGQQGVYVGRAHIRKALTLLGQKGLRQGQLNDYPMLQPIIDVSADNRTAKARWRSDVMLAADGQGEWGGGTYENEYVNDHGVWRIGQLHFFVTFFGDYAKGW